MAFFKEDSGTDNQRLKRIETWVWVLIYGGLLTFITGHFVAREDEALAQTMGVAGLVAVLAGIVLIYVRSRLREQDKPLKTGDKQ